jgi:sialate O-acetylesterase
MITSWRNAWRLPLPFYFVQIAPFKYGVPYQGSLIREQQARIRHRIPRTGMVVISDLVDDTADIHPKDKHDVGLRLAGWALAETYHRNTGMPYMSPAYASMEVKGDKIVVHCGLAPGGLVVKSGEVKEMVIAGEDEVFYPARVRIEGSDLIVSAEAVKAPVAVRYEFDNAGIGNIFGKTGLPLAPFRTDEWATGAEQ